MLLKVVVLSTMLAVLLSIAGCGPTDSNIETEAQAIGHVQNYLKGAVRNGRNCWDFFDSSDFWSAVKHEGGRTKVFGRSPASTYKWTVMTMHSGTGWFDDWTVEMDGKVRPGPKSLGMGC